MASGQERSSDPGQGRSSDPGAGQGGSSEPEQGVSSAQGGSSEPGQEGLIASEPAQGGSSEPDKDVWGRENALDSSSVCIYHEPQREAFCAVHALNNLTQRKIATDDILTGIAEHLKQDIANLDPETDESLGDPSGNYSIEVLSAFLKPLYGIELFNEMPSMPPEDIKMCQGFLIHGKNHWFAIRHIGKWYWKLDSLTELPTQVSTDKLIKEIKSLQKEGYTVFSVPRGLPELTNNVGNQKEANWHLMSDLLHVKQRVVKVRNAKKRPAKTDEGEEGPVQDNWGVLDPNDEYYQYVLWSFYTKVEADRQMHSKAGEYFRVRHLWLMFYPTAILTLIASILSLLAAAEGINVNTSWASFAAAIVAAISTFFQGVGKALNFQSRSDMHAGTAIDLQLLLNKMEAVWSYGPKINFSKYTARYEQAISSCKSEVPCEISQQYQALRSEVWNKYSDEEDEEEYSTKKFKTMWVALERLNGQITRHTCWRWCVPMKKGILDELINDLEDQSSGSATPRQVPTKDDDTKKKDKKKNDKKKK